MRCTKKRKRRERKKAADQERVAVRRPRGGGYGRRRHERRRLDPGDGPGLAAGSRRVAGPHQRRLRGGLLADSVGWRWAFAGQFPIAVLAWAAVFAVLQPPPGPDDAGARQQHWRQKLLRIDFLGAFALSAAAFVLLFGLDNGANEGWSRPVTVATLALMPVLFAVFVFIEVKVATNPFARGRVILHPPLLAAYGANFFGVAAQMGVLFFIAMFYQAAMALTATQSGLMFVPSTMLGLTGSLGGWLVMRKTGKYYGLTLTGYTVLLLSIVPLVLFTGALTKSMVGVVIGMAIMALGASICKLVLSPSSPVACGNSRTCLYINSSNSLPC